MPTTNTAHLDLDRIDLRILRLVLILSNTQSLTKTAAAMRLSVSQASRLLADARAIFGTEIFSRHGPQMVPSPQLLELLPRLQNVFKALDSLLGGASTLNILESSEVIRIAAVDNTAMVFIMPFLKELHQRAPKLGIEIVPLGSQSAAGLGSGAVDFMYACDPHLPADPSLRKRLLLASPHCVLVRKDHPLCEVPDGIVGPEELARYPMVIPTVSQPSGLNAMIMPFHEISSQRFLQSPFGQRMVAFRFRRLHHSSHSARRYFDGTAAPRCIEAKRYCDSAVGAAPLLERSHRCGSAPAVGAFFPDQLRETAMGSVLL